MYFGETKSARTNWVVFGLVVLMFTQFSTGFNYIDEIYIASLLVIAISAAVTYSRIPPWLLPILFVILVSFISNYLIVNGAGFGISIRGFWELWRGQIAVAIGAMLVYANGVRNRKAIDIALWLNVSVSLAQLFLGEAVIEVFSDSPAEYRSGIPRVPGLLINPNSNAFFIGLHILLYTAVLSERPKLSVRDVGGLVFLWMMLLATGSRTIFLILIPFSIYLYNTLYVDNLIAKITSNVKLIVILTSIVTLLIGLGGTGGSSVGYYVLPTNLFDRVDEGLDVANFRAFAVLKLSDRIEENPLFGLGFGTYGTPASFLSSSPFLAEDGISGSGSLTQLDMLLPVVFAESGILGGVLWLICWILLLRVVNEVVKDHKTSKVLIFWILIMIWATMTGPGITHPIVYGLLPIIIRHSKFTTSP